MPLIPVGSLSIVLRNPSLISAMSMAEVGPLKEFCDDVKKAVAQFEVMQLMRINAEGGSRGSQWLLERSSVSGWNKSHKIESLKDKKNEPKLIDVKEWKWGVEGMPVEKENPWGKEG